MSVAAIGLRTYARPVADEAGVLQPVPRPCYTSCDGGEANRLQWLRFLHGNLAGPYPGPPATYAKFYIPAVLDQISLFQRARFAALPCRGERDVTVAVARLDAPWRRDLLRPGRL